MFWPIFFAHNTDFWLNCLVSSSNSDFWPKCGFLAEMSIFGRNFVYGLNYNYALNVDHWRKFILIFPVYSWAKITIFGYNFWLKFEFSAKISISGFFQKFDFSGRNHRKLS